MNASPNCYAVIKHFERCVLKAYPDPKTGGAPYTCGWGATGPDTAQLGWGVANIGPGTVWTQTQADTRLHLDVITREDDVNHAVLVPLTQGQFDATVSALFNLGHGSPIRDGLIRLRSGYPSTFLRLLNSGKYDLACEALGQWVSPGSNVEHGLRRRRVAEQGLWNGLGATAAIALGDAA